MMDLADTISNLQMQINTLSIRIRNLEEKNKPHRETTATLDTPFAEISDRDESVLVDLTAINILCKDAIAKFHLKGN